MRAMQRLTRLPLLVAFLVLSLFLLPATGFSGKVKPWDHPGKGGGIHRLPPPTDPVPLPPAPPPPQPEPEPIPPPEPTPIPEPPPAPTPEPTPTPPENNMALKYIATDGHDDTGDGSIGNPWQTFGYAIYQLSAGDTLYARGGTYDEVIDTDGDPIASGTSWTNAITIAAYPSEVVLIDYTGTPVDWMWRLSGAEEYIIFDGIKMCGDNTFEAIIRATNGTNHIRVQNCTLYNTTYEGPGSYPNCPAVSGTQWDMDADYCEVLNCTIYNIGSHGCYSHESYGKFIGNHIYTCGQAGIMLYAQTAGYHQDYNEIAYNYIHDTSKYQSNACISLMGPITDHNDIYNNILYDDAYSGIRCEWVDYVRYNNIFNNTLYQTGSYGINLCDTGAYDNVIRNNIIYDCGTAIYELGSNTKSDNLTTDPDFINPPTDFHISGVSDARDTGYNLSETELNVGGFVDDDYDGNSRPQGGAYDIGAFEYYTEPSGTYPVFDGRHVLGY